MKITHKISKKLFKYVIFLLVTVCFSFWNLKNLNVHCGFEVSRMGLDVTNGILKNKHTIEFLGASGNKYILDAYLYRFDTGFLTEMKLNNPKNLKITKEDLYNTYNHTFMDYHLRDKDKFIEKELSDKMEFAKKEELWFSNQLSQFAFSSILTKQVFFKWKTSDNLLITENNHLFSYFTLEGDSLYQYLTTMMHILNGDNFVKFVDLYNKKDYIKNLAETKSLAVMFENLNINLDIFGEVLNTLEDTLQIIDPNKREIMTKKSYSLTNLDFEKKLIQKSLLEKNKIILKSDETFDYWRTMN